MTTATQTASWKTSRMRRAQPVGIIHSGSVRTIYSCAHCHAEHTVATRNRGTTKHEREFLAYHNSGACTVQS